MPQLHRSPRSQVQTPVKSLAQAWDPGLRASNATSIPASGTFFGYAPNSRPIRRMTTDRKTRHRKAVSQRYHSAFLEEAGSSDP
jgi:hypothetical protein